MTLMQRQHEPSLAGSVPTSPAGLHVVTVECVDGSVVQLQADGTDTVAEIRRIVLGQALGGGSAHLESSYAILAGGEAIDPATTVGQLVSRGTQLHLSLIKPGAWGPEDGHA